MEKKLRKSNIELLRIVLMLMIISQHMMFNILHFKNSHEMLGTDYSSYFKILFSCVIIVGVNAFVFISGYFGIKYKTKTLINLILQTLFYSVLIYLALVVTGYTAFNIKTFLFMFLPVSKNLWWFITAYITLYMLSPFLNLGFKHIDYKTLKIVLAGIIFLDCFSIFIFNNSTINTSGYSVFHVMTIYLIGRFLKEFHSKRTFKKSALVYFIISSFIVFVSVLIMSININAFWANKLLAYNNPFIVLSAIFLFFTFYNLNMKHYTFINYISSCVLGVYLFHEHPTLKKHLLYPLIQQQIEDKYGIVLFFYMAFIILSIFISGVFIDILRQQLMKKTRLDQLLNKLN